MLSLLLLFAAAETPKVAAPTESLRKVVIDAIRNCPKSTADEIAVCAPDRGISEGYRIPKMDRRYAKNLRASGRGELSAMEAEAVGISACSKVGASGGFGCSAKEYRAWRAERNRERAERGE